MLMCGVGAKPEAHLMKFHQLQWEVAQVKAFMNFNMTLTVNNLHQVRILRYKIIILCSENAMNNTVIQ